MSFLPEIDRKRTQAAVEAAMEKYRMFKFLSFEEREAGITAGYNERFHGPTNETSDQTASIAIYNVDNVTYRKEYCERVERVVKRMPRLERFLIEERYMTTEHDYITDQHVYCFVFQPPISEGKYSKIRWKAFYKLALDLNLMVEKEGRTDGEP
ncbi:ArpU family phage packaging/lysis transcriptional regulator [Paenibacillus crassostreae]|uniref:Transcriptional regulator n=1 Tax=Paenibacillus crassostreae TaxID=1763538 RepID=A0A167C6N8_9BACL|nr:ArpU family phage packaging/lysis transcriptional regulator [Paenibacillus crassostreae]AOZ91581.1 transcriptional regulator [Paenibacillus crassostreae]OAB72845.1 transcriptional regulator [Paenibacillus crassostreae]